MAIEHLGAAINELKLLLRGGADAPPSVAHVCEKHDVDETVLRRWIEKTTEKTPEEYGAGKWHVVTIDKAIAVAASRWVKNPYGPDLTGRRFHVDADDRRSPGSVTRRWYRYIGDKGYAIDAIDEETLKLTSFDGDPEIRRAIRREVKRALPYDAAAFVRSWGADRALAARRSVLGSIRLVLSDTSALKEVDERLRRAPTLTHLYRSLTSEQRAELADRISNPPVRMEIVREGEKIDPLLERNMLVLRTLEADEDVPSPIHVS